MTVPLPKSEQDPVFLNKLVAHLNRAAGSQVWSIDDFGHMNYCIFHVDDEEREILISNHGDPFRTAWVLVQDEGMRWPFSCNLVEDGEIQNVTWEYLTHWVKEMHDKLRRLLDEDSDSRRRKAAAAAEHSRPDHWMRKAETHWEYVPEGSLYPAVMWLAAEVRALRLGGGAGPGVREVHQEMTR